MRFKFGLTSFTFTCYGNKITDMMEGVEGEGMELICTVSRHEGKSHSPSLSTPTNHTLKPGQHQANLGPFS